MKRWLSLFVLLAAGSASAQQATPPTPEQVFLAGQLAALEELRRAGNLQPERSLSEILRLRLADGQIVPELLASDKKEEAIFPLKDMKGICQVQRFGRVLPVPNAMRLSVHVVDPKTARSIEINLSTIGRFQFDVIVSSAEQVTITTQMNAPIKGTFMGDDMEPRFYVQVIDEKGSQSTPSIQRSAETVAKLFDENHAQLLESMGEGLRLLRAMHLLSGLSEEEARQMLAANKPASSQVQKDIAAAVEQMKVEPEVGEKQLAALLKAGGPAAASALAKTSREGWSADVTMRIDNLLAPFLLEESNTSGHVNSKPHRLIDLLYWPDGEIRKAALERIQSLTDRRIELDPTADPYASFEKIERFRAELTPAD